MDQQKTLFDSLLSRIKNTPVVAALLVIGTIVIGLAAFTDAAQKLLALSGPFASTPALSKEAKVLLKETASDPSGLLLFEHFGASVDLHPASGVSLFTDKGDHYAMTQWESAIQELIKAGLLVVRDSRGEVFEITKKGYDTAKSAK